MTFEYRYFTQTNFVYQLSVERIDAFVDFAWGPSAILSRSDDATAVPFPPIPSARYTSLSVPHISQVQWSGYVKSPSPSAVTFTVTTDGSVRLFVNRAVVLNATAAYSSGAQSAQFVAKAVEMASGELSEIILEYERSSSSPVIRLQVDTCCEHDLMRLTLRFSLVGGQWAPARYCAIFVSLHSSCCCMYVLVSLHRLLSLPSANCSQLSQRPRTPFRFYRRPLFTLHPIPPLCRPCLPRECRLRSLSTRAIDSVIQYRPS